MNCDDNTIDYFPAGLRPHGGKDPVPKSPTSQRYLLLPLLLCEVQVRAALIIIGKVKTSSSRQRMGSLDNLSLLEMFGSAAPESTNSALLAFR